MEPQIIDYYNDEPSGVYVINQLNKEYDKLFDILDSCLLPSIKFNISDNYWFKISEQIQKNLTMSINNCIIHETGNEYFESLSQGLNCYQQGKISTAIHDSLILLTNDELWSSKITSNIIKSVMNLENVLTEGDIWEELCNSRGNEGISNMIYNTIYWELFSKKLIQITESNMYRCRICRELCEEIYLGEICEKCKLNYKELQI